MIDKALLSLAAMVFLAFPYLYIVWKKGCHKFLFISASVGGVTVIGGLLYIVALPFALLMIKVIPQIAEYDQTTHLIPMIGTLHFIQEYYFAVFLLLYLSFPALFYRRYTFFHKITNINTTNSHIAEGLAHD